MSSLETLKAQLEVHEEMLGELAQEVDEILYNQKTQPIMAAKKKEETNPREFKVGNQKYAYKYPRVRCSPEGFGLINLPAEEAAQDEKLCKAVVDQFPQLVVKGGEKKADD